MDIILLDNLLRMMSFFWLPILAPVLCGATILFRKEAPAIFYWPWFPLMEYVIAVVFAMNIWMRYLHVRQTLHVTRNTDVAKALNKRTMQLGFLAIVFFLLRSTNSIMTAGAKPFEKSVYKQMGIFFRFLLPIFPTIYCAAQVRLTNKTASFLCPNRLVRLARLVITSLVTVDALLFSLHFVYLYITMNYQIAFNTFFLIIRPYYVLIYWSMGILISLFVSTFAYEFYGARIARRPNQKVEKKKQ